MQRFLGGLHFHSLFFAIAHVSRIDGGLLPAIYVTNSPHAVQVAILYHCRLPFCHRYLEEGLVTCVHYQSPPVDGEVCGRSLQAQYYALSAWVAISDLYLRYPGQKVVARGANVDSVDIVIICEKSLGIEAACVVFGT